MPETYIPYEEDAPLITIKIHFNVWQKADGTGNWPETPEMLQLFQQMEFNLNEHFLGKRNNDPSKPVGGMYPHVSDTKIRFESEVFYYRDNALHGNQNGPTLINYISQHHPERLKGININIVRSTSNPGGHANLPIYNNDDGNLYIVTRNNQPVAEELPTGNWGFTAHISHELGHNFGLLHTYLPTCCHEGHPGYQPGVEPGHPDWLWDVFELEGENDWLCADPHEGICYHYYGWNCDIEDPQSGCTNNLMGGTSNVGFKSPLQIGRMRRALIMKTTRKYAKGYHETPYHIAQDEVWDFSMKFYQDLVIESGTTLTIKCELQMVPEAKIIINPGGKLVVDGGRIGTDFFAEAPWQGIYVEGDRTKPQTFANQGALVLQNGAIIENARTAVHVRGVDDNWWGNGGIVQANDAQFINNWRNVEFNAYQNTDSHGEEIRNVSYFTDVDFITNDQTLHSEHISNVTLWGVKGVRFISCEFTDNRTNIDFIASNKARNGILTSTASFYVSGSEFTNMKYGIYANSNASGHSFRVHNSNFSSYRGIYFNATDNVKLLYNNFTVAPGYTYSSDAGKCTDTYGVYINNSSHFAIEDNDFVSSSNGSTTCGSVGIIARSTGSHTNELYRNDFEGFTVGIEAIGENRGEWNHEGLELQCNRLDNGAWDFYVDYDVTARGISGIRELQGYPPSSDPNKLAGNLFGNDSPILVSNFVNRVDGSSISYFHHDPASESRVVPSIHSERPYINLFQSNEPFSYNDVCRLNLHPKSLDELVTEKQDAQTHYEETSVLLQAYVDDGNTQLMSQQVEMAGEGDAYYTYQYLMQTSPYLSEEVLTSLGAKEEGFNNAMIRDVMVENPQAAKSEEVNLALDSRIDQLPAYMRWQINNGLYQFSEKEIMEQFLAYQKTRHDQALNEIIRGIVHEQEGFENAPSLDQLLAQVDDVRYQYLRAELKFAEGDYAAGLQQLNQVAQQYDLSDENALQAHQDKTDFYTLLAQWSNHEDHPGFTNLPEEVLLQLENYLEATPRVAGKALSLLMLNDAIEYEEPILYPQEEMLPKTDPVSGSDEFMVPDMDSELRFALFPNPSRDYLTLDWCIESPRLAESGKIEFRNAAGVLVHTLATHIPCNQQILPLEGWKSGTYTATLTLNNQLRKTITFVVAQ